MQIQSLLPFLLEADRLKGITRQTLVHSGERLENSAEHSWHLALAALVFQKFAPPGMNLNRAIQMALLHDIVEVDAGDIFIYGDLSAKKIKEAAALERLFGLLPEDIGQELMAVWVEFENGESVEARYVSAIDRFLPLYSNFLNEGHSWRKHAIPSSRVTAKNEPIIRSGLPELWEVAKSMIEESVNQGHLSPA